MYDFEKADLAVAKQQIQQFFGEALALALGHFGSIEAAIADAEKIMAPPPADYDDEEAGRLRALRAAAEGSGRGHLNDLIGKLETILTTDTLVSGLAKLKDLRLRAWDVPPAPPTTPPAESPPPAGG